MRFSSKSRAACFYCIFPDLLICIIFYVDQITCRCWCGCFRQMLSHPSLHFYTHTEWFQAQTGQSPLPVYCANSRPFLTGHGCYYNCRYGMVIKIIFTFPLCLASLYPVCHMPSFHGISFWLPVPLRIHHIHSSYNGYSSS